MAGGLKKGAPYENQIAKELSYWWSDGERDDLVRRTQTSGGRATERSKSGQSTRYQHGDLSPNDPSIAPFFDYFLVEVKRGYNNKIDILEYLDLPRSRIGVPHIKMWQDKAEKDMKEGNRVQFMIFLKRDRRDPVLLLQNEFFEFIQTFPNYLPYTNVTLNVGSIVMVRVDDFFCYFEPTHFLELLK